jgi:hypothetical protein
VKRKQTVCKVIFHVLHVPSLVKFIDNTIPSSLLFYLRVSNLLYLILNYTIVTHSLYLI